MPKYKGVIIGAGAAAAGYDFLGSQEITTPAHGLKVHPRTSLEGFFDLDSARAKEAATKWQTKAFANLATMLETVKPDIVCVCTPDETHAGVLQEIIKYHRPKLVIAEKPLTTKLSDSNKVLGLYDRLGIPVLVNYRRRFDEIVQKIQQELARGEWGQVVGATAVYGKGLLHGGSHMIDLARFLLGEVESAKGLYAHVDYQVGDKTIGGFLTFSHCPQFYLMAADERAYSLFELEIVCTKGRIRFLNEGLEVERQKILAHPTNLLQRGYQVLGRANKRTTKLTRSAFGLIDNAVKHIRSGVPLLCSGREAAVTQAVCVQLARQVKN
jgi:predicted dehydrogenase